MLGSILTSDRNFIKNKRMMMTLIVFPRENNFDDLLGDIRIEDHLPAVAQDVILSKSSIRV